ncbi:MAG: hypothetical protein H7Z18_01640 [Methylophilaceae bacterium]|nr:hypothetical protein [Methylophilaceae bacterium]
MNTLWTILLRHLINLKNACLEELWILGLLLPIIALGIVGLLHFNHHDNQYVQTEITAKTDAVPEPKLGQLSEKEVAAIIALPLDKLIKVQVYSDQGYRVDTNGADSEVAATTLRFGTHQTALTMMNNTKDIKSIASTELTYQSKRNRKDHTLAGGVI